MAALGHSYGDWYESKAPTCTENGYTTYTCHCGERTVTMGDVNGDGWVDVEEAMLILQYEVGLIDQFPNGG